jgi:hypothetical protein
MKHAWILVIALAACSKKKDDDKAATPPPTPATLDAAAAPPTPAVDAVKLTAGELLLGCVGWSSKLNAAACFIGTTGLGFDVDVELRYLGAGAPAVKVGDPLEQATADAAHTYLAAEGYVAPSPGTVLVAGKDHVVGGATFGWRRDQTEPGGDNPPPTYTDVVTATCGAAKLELLSEETEGGDLEVTVHDQGARLLVVQKMHVGREGESSDHLEAVVLDPKTCVAGT